MKIANVSALTATALVLVTSNPASSQGISEGAGLWGAGAFGAGVGVAAGSKGANNLQARRGAGAAGIASLYMAAVKQERAGKLKDAARLMAQFAQEREKAYGARDPEVLRAYDKASSMASRAGSKADSDSYSRDAVEVCKKCFGFDAIQVRQRLIKLGDLPPKPGSVTSAPSIADAPASTSAQKTGADAPQATTADTKNTETASESAASSGSPESK